MLKGITKSQN